MGFHGLQLLQLPQPKTRNGGLVEVNPPFDEDLVQRAAQFCHASLEEAEHGC